MLVLLALLMAAGRSLAQGGGLVWGMFTPSFAVDRTGLYCVHTNRIELDPDPGKGNLMVGVVARVPGHVKDPPLVRVEFDTRSGHRQYGAGVMFMDKGRYVRILLFRDEKTAMAEATVPARKGTALVKKVYPVSEWNWMARANELVWDRRDGRVLLNGREVLRVEAGRDVKAERVALFGLNPGVVYRRLRFQTVGRAVNAASQGMVENTVTVLDEVFGPRTVLRRLRLLGPVEQEAGGAGDVMGP